MKKLCPECDSEIMPNGSCMMGHWCGLNVYALTYADFHGTWYVHDGVTVRVLRRKFKSAILSENYAIDFIQRYRKLASVNWGSELKLPAPARKALL